MSGDKDPTPAEQTPNLTPNPAQPQIQVLQPQGIPLPFTIPQNQPNQAQAGLYLVLTFDIDPNYANTLIQTINQTLLTNPSLKTIFIGISSGGGSVSSALAIYEYLKSLKLEVITHNLGSVDSSAVLVYLAGDKRYAVEGSSFLLHPIRQVGTLQNPSTEEAEDLIEIIHRHTKQYANLVAKSTKLTAVKAKQYMSETKAISTAEAVKIGLAHKKKALPDPLSILR
jgi:ATP-dependent Clp protease, protease subunit